MDIDKDDVRAVLLSAARGSETLGQLAGNPAIAGASAAAAGLITLVAGLLEQRTPEETRLLILDLAAQPARRVDLSDLDSMIEEAVRQRREREAAAEGTNEDETPLPGSDR